MRKPSQGKPVGVVEGGEGPGDAVGGEAGADMRIFGDVDGIVKADEAVGDDLSVDGEDGDEQKGADGEVEAGK